MHAGAIPITSSAKRTVPVYLIAFLAIVLASEAGFFVEFARGLLARPQYQFFPIMVLGALYLGYERWQGMGPQALIPGRRSLYLLLIFAACLSLVAGGIMLLRSLSAISLVFLVLALLYRVGASRLVRIMAPSCILLLAITPPPAHLDDTLTLNLQYLAVRLSSHLLDALHVPQNQAGNVLDIPGRRLLVEQACSGINSLLAIMGFALMFGFYHRRRAWQIALLMTGAMFFVIFSNVSRITLEAFLKVRMNVDVLEGAAHEMLGMLTFAAAALLTVSLDSVFDIHREPDHTLPALAQPARVDRHSLRVTSVDAFTAIAFILAGLFVQFQIHNAWQSPSIRPGATFDLPATIAGWQRADKGALNIERPQTLGAQSHVWLYTNGEMLASIAVDYPFVDYHNLSICYASSGWNIGAVSLQRAPDAREHTQYTTVNLHKPSGQDGYLCFSLLNEQGQWIGGKAALSGGKFSLWLQQARDAAGVPTYQTQTLLTSYTPITDQQRQSIQSLFFEARTLLAKQVSDQLEKK